MGKNQEKKTEGFHRTEIQSAAKNINKVLKPEPLMDDENGTTEELIKDLRELLPSIQEGDDLHEDTWATLKKMGGLKKNTKNPPEKAKTKIEKPVKAMEVKKVEKPKKVEKAKKPEKVHKLSRRDAVIKVLSEYKKKNHKFTTESAINDTNKSAIAGGNTDKIHQSKSQMLAVLDVLQKIGILELNNKNILRFI